MRKPKSRQSRQKFLIFLIMKNYKKNSVVAKVGALLIVAVFFIVACSKTDDVSPGSSANTTSEKVIGGIIKTPVNQPDGPKILATSVTASGCCCSHGTIAVTVTLDAATCSFYINGGASSLYFTWYNGTGCGSSQISSTARNVCSPVFCLTPGDTYYLIISTGINGTGSSSPCYSITI